MAREVGAPSVRAFVGRARELAALMSGLAAARDGRGTACLVCGEPGIGKSRLLAEFAAECGRLAVPVHWGLAWEAGGAPAYWPWIQVLRSVLAAEAGRAALRELPHLAPVLAELVPELVGSAGPGPGRLEPAQARFRLMDAVSTLLLAAAARGPLVVALEDAHAADPDTLALLEFAVRQMRAAPAMLLVSYREAEVQRPRIGNVLARVRREAIQVNLGRLDRDAVREFVRSATGRRPLEQTVTELYALTEGHPLYLAEVVELGIARGSFRATPASLSLAIDERAATLPQETRSLLGIASVLGREFALDAVAALAASPVAVVEERLGPAIAAGLIEAVGPGRCRFEHVLVREALHDALPVEQRRALHAERARRLESAGGAEPPWGELARHLEESGPEARARAAEAWRRAARQADARHAFDDAALCCARALALLGEDRAPPDARARLLLELAAAQIRAGDLEAGRRNSQEAFAIGERLGDAALMADAALTYGNVFTYGGVDQRLVRLLRAAFDALGPQDAARRARVLARLAAAMQPATDPAEPMRLAREAIRMARETGDPQTLLATLRSAVSALMDVGDPTERLALNREHALLGESLGDLSETARASMRMVVDGLELGDPATMDEAIGRCDALARRLMLPQYQWIAAACRAMSATMRGEFDQAEEALAQAARFAERSEDPNAARTLLLQRLALATTREHHEEMARLAPQVEGLCAGLSLADVYLRPGLLLVQARIGGPGAAVPPVDAAYVEAVIRFHDTGALCALGELLVALGDRANGAKVYECLLPQASHCGHSGLTGLTWSGPIARVLALLAQAAGDGAAADRHFAQALDVARRMGARPWIARILLEWGETLAARGGADASRARALLDEARVLADELGIRRFTGRIESVARPPSGPAAPAGVPKVAYFQMQRDGEVWKFVCEGQEFRLRDTRGLQMLAELVAHPGREFHVLDLASGGAGAADGGDAGELLDERARREYRARIDELRAEAEEAESLNDIARAEAARSELEALGRELARAYGLGGRSRRAGSAVERARVNVQRRLKDAILRIGRECPAAGRHLEWAVRTGTYCCYSPD